MAMRHCVSSLGAKQPSKYQDVSSYKAPTPVGIGHRRLVVDDVEEVVRLPVIEDVREVC